DGSAVVTKFYRPGRWSEAQIQEEHDFSAALALAEVPAVPPLRLAGATLHHFGGFSFSVSPRRGGRPPDLDNVDVLEWIGRFMARFHLVGAAGSFAHRPALTLQTFGTASRDWLLDNEKVPLDVQRIWADTAAQALELVDRHDCLAGRAADGAD